MNARRFHHTVTRISRPPGTPEDAWDLYCAAAEGHLPTIRELVEKDPELMHYQIWYEFPVHFAVREGHADAVRLLLEAGTNPAWSYFRYSSWQKLLPIAEQRGHTEVHEILVADMKRRFNYDPNFTTLFAAIGEKADVDEVFRIIAQQPERIHAGDEHGNRPLHWAILARRMPVIEKLLDAGADIQARRADLQTPLHLATRGGDYWFENSDNPDRNTSFAEVADYLLERGAEYEFNLAVFRGDRERIDEILANDPGAATRLSDSRCSPLGLAASKGHIEIVRLLLERGADPNLPEECCPLGAALIQACWRADVEMARLLLEHGADTRAEADSSGSCYSAVENSKSERAGEMMQLLKEYGGREAFWQLDGEPITERMRADESIASDEGATSSLLQRVLSTEDIAMLHEFIDRFGDEPIRKLDPSRGWVSVADPDILDELIRHGMDINRPDWFGRTFLHYFSASENASTKVVGQYLDRGIDINTIDVGHGTTALGVAAMNGNSEIVKYLLERGADPSIPADQEWAQPLALANREQKWKAELAIRTQIILKQLKEDPASVLKPGAITLHLSAHYSEEEIVKALLEAGAEIEAEHPSMGGKPLHWATEGNARICQWLIERGADVNSRVVSENERNGMTPLIYCAWWCGDDDECIKIAKLLIESGADITARDAEDKSAVQRALQQGHNHLADALKASGG